MISQNGRRILEALNHKGSMDGPDIEQQIGLSEQAIKSAAIELGDKGFVTTSGAPNANKDGMDIDRVTITPLGRRQTR